MRPFLATFLRELRAYFLSPLAYLVLFFFLIINGIIFAAIIGFLSDPRASGTERPMDALFGGGGFFFWLVFMIICTVLTMRLISEELRSGSIEVLMTAPITEAEVVTAKYLAALTFFCALWIPTLLYGAILAHYSKVDWGPIAGGYFGIFCLGAMCLAVGIFASAMTRSQLVAAIMTFTLLTVLFIVGLLGNLFNNDTIKQALSHIDLVSHMDEFRKGIVDTRRLIYYASAIFFFLFLASRTLEDRKWR
ncbi:MAG TPA: ABC transporter permease [Thermoanaerobaculia bacterium]|nr:ABC transporter permease [Thermoanaerobaculia bacterium]